jgi:hypothetical protein
MGRVCGSVAEKKKGRVNMMKKIAFVLAVLVMAAPAMADVTISVAAGPGPNDVTVSYDGAGVRAFALDIIVDDPCMSIVEVNCVSTDYFVYPGSVGIEGGEVTDDGTCNCGGIDTNAVCVEMGSCYLSPEAVLDIPAGDPPAASGDLVILTLGGCDENDDGANVSVEENAIRGGVVMEDGSAVTVVSPGGSADPCLPSCRVPDCTQPEECAGHASGDSTCDGSINLADLFALKAAFGKSAPWTAPDCCSDYNNDNACNLGDLFVLKAGFGTSGYDPSTGNQDCP